MTGFTTDLDQANADGLAHAWEQPPRQPPASAAPTLAVDGFEGPLDWLLEMARAQRIDLAKLSILALVEAFTAALNTALGQERATRVDLTRWGDWLVMAATLALWTSRRLGKRYSYEAEVPGPRLCRSATTVLSARNAVHAHSGADPQDTVAEHHERARPVVQGAKPFIGADDATRERPGTAPCELLPSPGVD